MTSKPKKKSPNRSAPPKKYGLKLLVTRLGLLVILALATVFLSSPLPTSYDLSLLPGDITGKDIKADRDLMILDQAATKEKHEDAERNSPTVFDYDDQSAQVITERVNRLFEQGRTIFNAPKVTVPVFETVEEGEKTSPTQLATLKKSFQSAFNLDPADRTFSALAEIRFSRQAERVIVQMATDILNQGLVAEKSVLLGQPGAGVLIRYTHTKQEVKAPDPNIFPSLEEAQRSLKEKASLLADDFEPDQVRAIINVAKSLLIPNLVLNQKETEYRKAAEVASVAPVYFQVKRGEMIVREGERIDELARLKLDELALKTEKNWLPKAGGVFLLVTILLLISSLTGVRVFRNVNLKDRDLVFLATLFLVNLLLTFASFQVGEALEWGRLEVANVMVFYLAPLASGPMLTTIFLGPLAGLLFALAGSAISALIFDQSLALFFYLFIGAIVGLSGVVRVRERSQVTKTGLIVGLINMTVITALSVMEQSFWTLNIFYFLGAGLLAGVLSGVLVTGLVPLFEMVFGYTTDIKLLELANLDRPILRELMVQAPGTYHHSVIVGAMVEAAAEAIGANPLLAKVSAYYHDLGKMKKPLYFVENQLSCGNRHEKLAPSMSALILISHVKDGLELARKNKLSPIITDIIQQHHGTSLIAYFYQKAKNNRTEDQPEINIENYRYPSPKPQTREAGLVMLADAVEAASRTLGDPTPSRVQGMVQKLINNIFSDGQLDECELTLKDLHLIAKSFNKILTGIFHRRISYPEPASKDRAANGNSHKQPTKDTSDRDRADHGERKEDLRRLGIS